MRNLLIICLMLYLAGTTLYSALFIFSAKAAQEGTVSVIMSVS